MAQQVRGEALPQAQQAGAGRLQVQPGESRQAPRGEADDGQALQHFLQERLRHTLRGSHARGARLKRGAMG
ncbi:hypothetical protein APZ41_020475, partial [Roseomonas mucosa]